MWESADRRFERSDDQPGMGLQRQADADFLPRRRDEHLLDERSGPAGQQDGQRGDDGLPVRRRRGDRRQPRGLHAGRDHRADQRAGQWRDEGLPRGPVVVDARDDGREPGGHRQPRVRRLRPHRRLHGQRPVAVPFRRRDSQSSSVPDLCARQFNADSQRQRLFQPRRSVRWLVRAMESAGVGVFPSRCRAVLLAADPNQQVGVALSFAVPVAHC
jgi:hypothetical protein